MRDLHEDAGAIARISLCACRAASILGGESGNSEMALCDLSTFINERWKGMMPVAWGQTLVEAQFMSWIYEGLCGINQIDCSEETLSRLSKGADKETNKQDEQK